MESVFLSVDTYLPLRRLGHRKRVTTVIPEAEKFRARKCARFPVLGFATRPACCPLEVAAAPCHKGAPMPGARISWVRDLPPP